MKDNPVPSSFMQAWVSFITLTFVRHLLPKNIGLAVANNK